MGMEEERRVTKPARKKRAAAEPLARAGFRAELLAIALSVAAVLSGLALNLMIEGAKARLRPEELDILRRTVIRELGSS